jgi:16S rRNA (cytosine967-C5)-methyltransferase
MKLAPCIKVLKRVLKQHQSLTECFALVELTPEQKAICYGVIRWYFQLEFILNSLLNKPLKDKNFNVALHIYVGLFQLLYGDMPEYAAVKEVVNNIKNSKFRWAVGLTNKTLRTFIDNKESILKSVAANNVAQYAHPEWMVNALSPQVLQANNQQAPMTLRVNLNKIPRSLYLKMLAEHGISAKALGSSNTAIQLKAPVSVTQLPKFDEGVCSVQDETGQLIPEKLGLKPGMRVLDACCAPGSKTCHILETEPELEQLVAIDIDEQRLKKVAENIDRLQLNKPNISLIAADALDVDEWWDNKPFDCILLDVPCSASGVIRRHPDIKVLRRETDITDLQQRQNTLLQKLFPLLKPDGKLIYSTCSVFDAENTAVIENFCKNQDFEVIDSQQLYPKPNAHDGFYIAVIKKSPKD